MRNNFKTNPWLHISSKFTWKEKRRGRPARAIFTCPSWVAVLYFWEFPPRQLFQCHSGHRKWNKYYHKHFNLLSDGENYYYKVSRRDEGEDAGRYQTTASTRKTLQWQLGWWVEDDTINNLLSLEREDKTSILSNYSFNQEVKLFC